MLGDVKTCHSGGHVSTTCPTWRPLIPRPRQLLTLCVRRGSRGLEDLTPQEARAWSQELFVPDPSPLSVHSIIDHTIQVDGGTIRVRVYDPDPSTPLPIMVYLHGGGWVLGGLESADSVVRRLVVDCHCIVVSVDYRLAPEFPFPVGYEDCLAAIQWTAEHASQLGGVAGDPLALGGDSSGGNLAAACAIALRDSGGPSLSCQYLAYPVTDADMGRPSMHEQVEKALERAAMIWFWDHYCPDLDQREDWRACPIKATSLAKLPPALVTLSSHDPLYDEGLEYAHRLQAAGVPTTIRVAPDLIHGYLGMTQQSRRADEEVGKVNAILHTLVH